MHLESLKVNVRMRRSQSWQFQLGIYRAKRGLFSEEKGVTCVEESLFKKAQ